VSTGAVGCTLEWNDSLLLGIPAFDAEHKSFIRLICRFMDMVERAEHKVLVDSVLDKIVDTFRFHSVDEENLLEAHGYDWLEAHQAEHDRISELLNSLRMEFMVVEASPEHVNIARTIGTTITAHIRDHDRHYADFLRQKGIA
jgi:hemerythrin-like metal-binding protein